MEKQYYDIYPFDDDCLPILEYITQMVVVKQLIMPNSWQFDSQAIKNRNLDIEATYIKECDLEKFSNNLIIVPSRHFIESIHLVDIIRNYLKEGKIVICMRKLPNYIVEELEGQKTFYYFKPTYSRNYSDSRTTKIEKIDIPVVCVCGLLDNTDKFLVQERIVTQLKKKGKKVLWICSQNYASFLDAYNISDFFDNCSYENVVVAFNHYVKALQKQKMPDIIVVGIPGTVVPINKHLTGDYGVLFYIVSNAIPIDYLIVNMPYEPNLDINQIEMLRKVFYYRFGKCIDQFCLSDKYTFLIRDGNQMLPAVKFVDGEKIKSICQSLNSNGETAVQPVWSIDMYCNLFDSLAL